ncbi:type III toxin-antitoxin system ToxN/AbiQ family toxin, partial [Fusobacterium necrophorum]
MYWCSIDKEYIQFLKTIDSRIPHAEYGKEYFKPFFAPLFERNGLVYVSQISSAKPRHNKLKEDLDFFKIYSDKTKKLISVVNINFMFPVPKNKITFVKYSEIDKYRKFENLIEKSNYIHLLKYELKK